VTYVVDGMAHAIGCSEWARAHEEQHGRERLDARTLTNLDEMKARGRASCCKVVEQLTAEERAALAVSS
jgi:hypothetical protein